VTRVFVRPDAVDANRVRFDAAEAHHLRRVLRLRPGAMVEGTDGAGGLYTIRLVALDVEGGWGAIEARDEPERESPCAITLAQAILKGDRMSWLVQKATELGVSRIVPMETARVVARPATESVARQTRWQRIAREAVKQCGRVVVPAIDRPRAFTEVIGEIAAYDAAWVCWEGGGQPLVEAAAGTLDRLLLLIGPEGGFAEEERALLLRQPRTLRLSLGPRILRADTAGVAALALVQAALGDWTGPG
jgi:16S rRNA (uracil1498-N3)-methyltransferase